MNIHQLLVILGICLTAHSEARPLSMETNMRSRLARPLLFTENVGQVRDADGRSRPDIRFTAISGGTKIYLSPTGIHYQFARIVQNGPDRATEEALRTPKAPAHSGVGTCLGTLRTSVSLAGANPHPRLRTEGLQEYTERFYLSGVDGMLQSRTYDRIVWEDVYPGIDWVIYSKGGRLEYDFIVHPGANPGLIRLQVQGADRAWIHTAGGLSIRTVLGEVQEGRPVSFAGGRLVSSRLVSKGQNLFGFDIGDYDKLQTLRIDPEVTWSTYYGGGTNDEAYSCAADGRGNVYAVGRSGSLNFPVTSGALQTTNAGNYDMVIVKMSSSGAVLWSTYYGGTADEIALGCRTDGNGNLYVTGWTMSTNFPVTPGAAQGSNASYFDCILLKLDSSGSRQWATYLGGAGADAGNACATDSSGNVYVTGTTSSGNFPVTSGAVQGSLASSAYNDNFLAKFSSSGTVQWATYFGGSGDELANACAVDYKGNVYMAGYSTSSNYPVTTGAVKSTVQYIDAILTKFSSSGAVKWSTFYGGSAEDIASGCATDRAGNVFISGTTSSTDFPASPGAAQDSLSGSKDAFMVKLDSTGTVRWSTCYGGSLTEMAAGCATDSSGCVYMTGYSQSNNLYITNGMRGGNEDVYIARYSAGGALQWSWVAGGNTIDKGFACASDISGNLYVTGYTGSSSFPVTANAVQGSNAGYFDIFLMKIHDINCSLPDSLFCAGDTVLIPCNPTMVYGTGNVFTAQLSNAAGSFTTPVVIGSLVGTGPGIIRAVIPSAIAAGTGYRIRIVATAPATIGTDNGADIAIHVPFVPVSRITATPSGPLGAGTPVTFSAVSSGGGTRPQYQWVKNGVDITGETGSSYTASDLATGDVIWVRLTSNAPCANPAVVNSDSVTMVILPVRITSVGRPGATFTIAPNPNKGTFTLRYQPGNTVAEQRLLLRVLNVTGNQLYAEEVDGGSSPWAKNIKLGEHLPAGLYLLQLLGPGRSSSLPFMVSK